MQDLRNRNREMKFNYFQIFWKYIYYKSSVLESFMKERELYDFT